MLRVTVELWPGRSASGKRVIATADIGRVRDGTHGDYEVELMENSLADVGEIAVVRDYPRWSASVWDLVARSIAAALNCGREELPPRPTLPQAPVHARDGLRYVDLSEIPEPTRTLFALNLIGSSTPFHGCAFAHDWDVFLLGRR